MHPGSPVFVHNCKSALRRYFLQNLEHLGGVVLRTHLMKNVQQALPGTGVRADHEGRSLHTLNQFAVHALGPQQIVALNQNHLWIGQQVERKIVLALEVLLRLYRVTGDAEHGRAMILELLKSVTEAAGLDGTAGGIGAGKEEEDEWLIGEVGQVDSLAVLVLKSEIFDGIVDVHAVCLWESFIMPLTISSDLSSEAESSTFHAVCAGSICRISPASTLPGPTSMNRVTP